MARTNGTGTLEPRALAASGRHNARSITAAAKRIDLTSSKDRACIPRSALKWSLDAWGFYDIVPEVKFAGRFLGNCLSRLVLFPGLRIEPEEPHASLGDILTMQTEELELAAAEGRAPNPDRMPAPGLDEAMVTAAEEELARLANRRTGQAGLLRSWGVCLTIGGDSWLIGTDELDEEGEPTGEEEWQVLSDLNVSRKGDTAGIRLAPGAPVEELPESATMIRVWRPHEAWPALADSNMRAALDTCDEFLIYARQFRSVGKSRNHNGVLLVPTELDFTNQATIDPDTGLPSTDELGLTPLEAGMVKSMITPVEDDGSASAVVPHFLRGPAEYLKEVRHLGLDRKIDDQAIGRLNFLLARLAHGLDVPVEILLGLGEVNHWTAWQIEDSTYKAHVEPLAELPRWGITTAYLRPMLQEHPAWQSEEAREILRRVECAINPNLLVQRPNRGQDAKDAHKALVLSDAALRRELSFADSDGPSDDELLRRYALDRGIGAAPLTRELLRGTVDGADEIIDETAPATEEGAPGEDQAAPAEQDQPTPPADDEAIAAAALDPFLLRLARIDPLGRAAIAAAASGNIGQRLAAIDARLRARLQEAASAALEEALRIAGQRLRGRLTAAALRAATKGHDGRNVGPILAALGALTQEEEDESLEGAFVALGVKWDELVSQAQDDVEAVIRSAADEEGAPLESAVSTYRATTDEDRHAGWLVLSALLLSVARQRMRGLEEDSGEGEFDATVAVQAGPVREALARAGGSVELGPPVQIAGHLEPGIAGGVATGPRALGGLARVGLRTVGWEWTVGAPSVPFPPHQALAGVQFTSWDDTRLSSGGFPYLGHYFPGDHKGCQCDTVPVIIEGPAAPHRAGVTFDEWLELGIAAGYCTEAGCQMHEGMIGLTDEEAELFEDDGEPCVPVVRLFPLASGQDLTGAGVLHVLDGDLPGDPPAVPQLTLHDGQGAAD